MGEIITTVDKKLDIASFTLEGEVSCAEICAAIESYYKGTLTKYTIWIIRTPTKKNI